MPDYKASPRFLIVDLPVRFRQSSLEDAKCLHAFDNYHIKKIKRPDTVATKRGSHFHKLAHVYVDHLRKSDQPTDYDFAEQLAGNDEGSRLFVDWSTQRIFEPATILDTEWRIRLGWDFKAAEPEASIQDSPFSGDLDLVSIEGQRAFITDYKTNFGIFVPETIQSVYYPWLVSKLMPGLKEITFTLDFVRYNSLQTRTFSMDEIQDCEVHILAQVDRVLEALESKKFPAESGHAGCSWCPLTCPLVEAGLDRDLIGQIKDMKQARQMAMEAYALQTRYNKVKEILKNYSTQHGDIAIVDRVLGFTKFESLECDPVTVHRLNVEHGFEPLRGLKADNAILKRIYKDYPDYKEKVRKTAKDRGSTKFQFFKPKE